MVYVLLMIHNPTSLIFERVASLVTLRSMAKVGHGGVGLEPWIYIDLGKLKRPHVATEPWESWFVLGKSSPNGRTIQVSEILFHLPRLIYHDVPQR